MELYNTLSHALDLFEPVGPEVTLYACGITPYDTTHLGHAFTYTTVDILIRFLEAQGYRVKYVQNVTDIDDDILGKANEVGQNWHTLGNQWTAHFINDMRALNIRPPDYFPRATDVIPEMIFVIEQLLAAGMAYQTGGGVYFNVKAFPEFGKLSRLSQTEMLPIANNRGNNPDDPYKQNPLDFVLWQTQAPGEPAWDSPWGLGRPGWHIECSTMATQFLGKTVDIHCGGSDLLFPHHECEIAQVESVTGQQPFVRFWLHTAMVHHKSEKMSKSLGNLILIEDLLERWSADEIRVYLADHHYRSAWNHNEARLEQARQLVQRLSRALTVSGGSDHAVDPGDAQTLFTKSMNYDLNTPTALLAMSTLAGKIITSAALGYDVNIAQTSLQKMCRIFGLQLTTQQQNERVLTGWNKHLQRFKVDQNQKQSSLNEDSTIKPRIGTMVDSSIN